MWMKEALGGYVNIDSGMRLRVDTDGSSFVIQVRTLASAVEANLAGTYGTVEEAQQALRRLIYGYDPEG